MKSMKSRKSLCGLNTRLSYSLFTVICAQITLILTSIAYLLFYYHSESYKDVGVYIQNARMLLHGENPYISGTARWGQFGQFFLLGIANLIKFNLAPSIFQPGHLFNFLITTETFIVLLFLYYKKFKKILP